MEKSKLSENLTELNRLNELFNSSMKQLIEFKLNFDEYFGQNGKVGHTNEELDESCKKMIKDLNELKVLTENAIKTLNDCNNFKFTF